MPFLIVGLGDLAAGLLCLLASIALTYLVRAIADGLPDIGIGPFVLRIADAFRSAGDSAINWMVDNTKHLWASVEGWVNAHAFLMDSAFGAVVQAVNHVGDQIAHIVTHSIPNAIDAAESYVGRELVTLKNGIETDIAGAVAKVEAIVKGDVKILNDTIQSDVNTVENDITKAVTTGLHTAETYADRGLADLKGYTEKAISDAESIASSALADARRQIGAAIAGVAATAYSELQGAEHTLENEISAAARTAAADLATAERTISGEISGVASSAAAALKQTAAALGGEISTAEQSLQGQIGQAVGTLTGDITTEAQTFAGDLSNLQGMLQAAIAASIAGVISRVVKLEKCSVGVCEDSPNNFGNLLKDAMGLASLAGVGAFLDKAIERPAAAEHEFGDTIEGLYGAGQSAFHHLLSL